MPKLYPPRDDALDDYRNEIRLLPTRLLLEQQESYGWQLAEISTGFGVAWREESIAFLRFKHEEIERELAWRRGVKSRTATPVWPDGVTSDRDYWARVKAATDLPALIAHRVPDLQWRRAGEDVVTNCPFGIHPDTTPSFSVDPAQQLFYCFGCGIGGDCFTFVMTYDDCSFAVAVATLAAEAGLVVPPTQVVIKRDGEEHRL